MTTQEQKQNQLAFVADKIQRIRMVSDMKQQLLKERRQTAIKNQERLRDFIQHQKENQVDLRPQVYTDDR